MKAKKNTNGIKKTPFILGVAFIALGCTLGISSFAWFYLPQSTRQVEGMDGEATGSYFSIVNQETKIADGTSKNPYGIKTAKQLYYFNWLQDLGYFNKDENGDGFIDQQYCFVLMDDIDASNYVLPPAGTKEYPFVGNFEGNGHTISNLRISNSWDDLTDKPQGAKQDANNDALLSSAEIVGFFGIVGQYSSSESTTAESVTTGSVNCKAKDGSAKTATYTIRSVSGTGDSATTTYVNAVNNLYFDKLEVNTLANETLAGLLAGYVNGQMQYCGVRSGNFSFGSNVKVLTDSVLGTSNDKLSKYSIVGDYNSNNFNWNGKPKSSSGSTWGDSVDIYSVSKRLGSIYGTITPSGSNLARLWTSDTYHLNGGLSSSTAKSYDYKGETVSAMLLSGTYLPLSVTSDPTTYTSGGNETVADTNGGYIVGGGSSSYATASYVRVRNVVETKKASDVEGTSTATALTLGIMNSISEFSSSGESLNGANLSFLYYDSVNKKHYRIRDDENKDTDFKMASATNGGNETAKSIETDQKGVKTTFSFNNYNNVKSNLISTLNSVTAELGKSGVVLPGMLLINQTSTETYTATGGVKISGKSYTSYEFYKGGINFTLKEDGYVSIVLGTYTNSYQSPYFYKFYELTREEAESTSAIKDAKEINRISGSFKDKNLSYEYKDGTSETSFDQNKLSFDFTSFVGSGQGVFRNYAAYFIEVPLKKGSYFMSPSIKSSYMPYLLYFDIGENASGGSSVTSQTPDIDFVYYKDATAEKKEILPISDSNFKGSGVYFEVKAGPTSIYYWRSSNESVVYYYVVPNASSDMVSPKGSGSGTESDEASYKSEFETSN